MTKEAESEKLMVMDAERKKDQDRGIEIGRCYAVAFKMEEDGHELRRLQGN